MSFPAESFYRELGRNVARLRKRTGLTQDQLANAIELTRTSVANIEAGRQKVLAHTLVEICNTLGVRPVEVLPRRPTPRAVEVSDLRELPSRQRNWVLRVLTGESPKEGSDAAETQPRKKKGGEPARARKRSAGSRARGSTRPPSRADD